MSIHKLDFPQKKMRVTSTLTFVLLSLHKIKKKHFYVYPYPPQSFIRFNIFHNITNISRRLDLIRNIIKRRYTYYLLYPQ